MEDDTLYTTYDLCDSIEGLRFDQIYPKLKSAFGSQIGNELFRHIKVSHCNQAVFFDNSKNYTLFNIYKYFKQNQNIWNYDHINKTIQTTTSSTAKTINIYEPFTTNPDLDTVPKKHLITTQDDDGLQKDRRNNVFLSDAQAKHYYVNIDDILNHFDYWFTTNLSKKIHDKILPIPIGISPQQAKYTKQQIEELRSSKNKNKLCNCRMSISSQYRETVAIWANESSWIDDFIVPRGDSLDIHSKENYKHIFTSSSNHADYMNELTDYCYSICPPGNGLDTYRLYECIVCNTVPIVQHNYANYIFSKIWPMILVHKYESEDIQQKIKDFEKTNPNIDYDYGLLLRSNIDQLMERIKYECRRDNEKSWKVVL